MTSSQPLSEHLQTGISGLMESSIASILDPLKPKAIATCFHFGVTVSMILTDSFPSPNVSSCSSCNSGVVPNHINKIAIMFIRGGGGIMAQTRGICMGACSPRTASGGHINIAGIIKTTSIMTAGDFGWGGSQLRGSPSSTPLNINYITNIPFTVITAVGTLGSSTPTDEAPQTSV